MSAFIQNVCAGLSASATASSVTVTVTTAVSAHQGTIIVAVGFGNTASASVSSVTDSKGNTYVHDFSAPGNASNEALEFWRCADPAAGLTTSDTITATCSAAATKGVSLVADLYVHLGSPDVTASNFVSTTNTVGSVTVTPQASDTVAIASCAFNDNNTTITVSGTFTVAATQVHAATGEITQATAYMDNPGTSAVTATFTGTTAHTSISVAVTYPLQAAAPQLPQPGSAVWRRYFRRQQTLPSQPPPPAFTSPSLIEASGTLSSAITKASSGASAVEGSGELTGTVSKNITIVSAVQGSGAMSGLAAPPVPVVTLCGSGAQAIPFSSAQPPAQWQSLQIPVTNVTGDWMFAIVAWRQNVAGAGVPVTVGDDTMRNFWQPLGIPNGTSSAAGVPRVAIWVAPAAYAASYVTVAPAGGTTAGTYAMSLCCLVFDVSGLAPWLSLAGGAAVTAYVNSASTLAALTTAAPGAQSIFWTGFAWDNDTLTGSGPGAGWSFSGGNNTGNGTDSTSDLNLDTAYIVSNSAAVTANWSASGSADLAGVVAGVVVQAAAPAQASPDWPVTIAELAPGGSPHTPADTLTWVPVTARALELQNVVQGAQYNLAALTSASGAVVFDNPDGALIAPGTGPFAGISSGTPFRIRQEWPGGSWQLQWKGNGTVALPGAESGTLIPVTALSSYSWGAWLGASASWSGGMQVAFDWQGASGHISYSTSPVVTASPVAQLAVVAASAPAGATGVYMLVQAAGTPPSGTTFRAASAPQDGAPGRLPVPPGVTWTAINSATSTTLAPWVPDPKGPPNATPHGVPFSGYIRSWPQAWDPDLLRGVTTATVTDAWGYCNGNVQPILVQEILNDAPYAYWPCTDAAGSVQATNYAPGNSKPLKLTLSKHGAGAATEAFGQNSGAILGAQGTYLLSSSVRAQASGGMWGQGGVVAGASPTGYSLECTDGQFPSIANGITVEGWFQWNDTTNNIGFLLSLMTATGNVFNFFAGTSAPFVVMQSIGANGSPNSVTLVASPAIPSGAFHLVATFNQTTYKAWVNGVLINPGGNSWVNPLPARFQYLWVNGNLAVYGNIGGGQYQGYSGHVAVFGSQLTPERIATHYQAGASAMAGDTPDARIERLLQAGNNYPGPRVILQDYSLDITPCASCQDAAGQAAATSIQNIAASTAPAVLAVSPPGYLTYLSRGHIWNQPVRWVLGNNTSAGEIPFQSGISYAYDPLRLTNDVQMTQLDNQDIVVPVPPVGGYGGIDWNSQQANGDQPYWVTGYLKNDLLSPLSAGPGLLEAATWIGAVNAVPGNRIGGITVDAKSHPDAWTFFMTVAKGDIITVNWRPPTASGLTLSVTGRVSQTTRNLKWSLDGCTGSVSLLIDVAPEMNALTLDDPARGQLTGQNVLGW